MATPNKRLRAVLEYLGITNIELARALACDPSLISQAAAAFGSQAVVVAIDAERVGCLLQR